MKLVIIRLRSVAGADSNILTTVRTLGLNKTNSATIREDTPIIKGMIKLIEPFITYGPIDEKMAATLKKKGNNFNLQPPRKGYGRKGVKTNFKNGGAYGNRGEKINELLSRMM